MTAAAVAPTINRGVALAVDASATSSASTAAALIVTTLIITTLITAALLLVASILLALTLVALLVATSQTVGPDSGSFGLRTVVVGLGVVLVGDLRVWRRFMDCCICWICPFKT